MPLAEDIRQLGDQLRAISAIGLRYTADDPYNSERYRHITHIAAELFALADERGAEEIERTLFRELTHVAPVPCVDAAVIDDEGRILLIQRADDSLWAMPGGLCDMGETPAETARRETAEEAGFDVLPVALAGIYDSRFCETRSSLQLYQFVFLCRPIAPSAEGATTPHEVLDLGWFTPDELPPLSAGHTVRVPHALTAWKTQAPTYFDALGGV